MTNIDDGFPFQLVGIPDACMPGDSRLHLAAAQPPLSRGAVPVKGASLPYVIEGTGQACLVLGSSIYYPRAFSKDLRQHLRLAFVDLRHFAPSDPSIAPQEITLETYANDIEAVRTQLGLGKVIVLGHSIHGNIALEYARRYPEHVSRLIVIGSPPVGTRRMSELAEAFWNADASEERKRVMKRNWEGMEERVKSLPASQQFIQTYILNGPRYWYDPTYDAAWLWRDVYANAPILDHLYGVLFKEYDLAQGPRPIATPAFLALGRYDYAIPYTAWNDERRKLPDLSYNLFEKCGHTPQLEVSAEFDRRLIEWLRRR